MERINKVRTYINNIIIKRNIIYIEKALTIAEILKNLKKKLVPNDESELLRVRIE